jgi:hypothetical protein
MTRVDISLLHSQRAELCARVLETHKCAAVAAQATLV